MVSASQAYCYKKWLNS